jgi:hypothetical protein
VCTLRIVKLNFRNFQCKPPYRLSQPSCGERAAGRALSISMSLQQTARAGHFRGLLRSISRCWTTACRRRSFPSKHRTKPPMRMIRTGPFEAPLELLRPVGVEAWSPTVTGTKTRPSRIVLSGSLFAQKLCRHGRAPGSTIRVNRGGRWYRGLYHVKDWNRNRRRNHRPMSGVLTFRPEAVESHKGNRRRANLHAFSAHQ